MADFQTTLVALFVTVFLSVITWGYGQDSKLVYTAILGMQQHYHLGRLFHQRYSTELKASYLFDNYTRTQIYVRSTDVDRTLMSAQCQLASLFEPNAKQRFIPDLNWQPIPIHTVPTAEDNVLMGYAVDCPTYKDLIAKIPDSPEYKKISAEYKDFFEVLQNWTGVAKVNASNVWKIADVVYVQFVHNLSSWMPWATPEVRQALNNLSIYNIKWMFDSVEKSRLACGNLVNVMVDEMHMKVNGSCKEEKIHFFSAHDTTVACLLSAFRVFDMRYPKYTSSVIVEFYKTANKDYYVEVWYKYGPMVERNGELYCNSDSRHPFNKTVECLEPLVLPGCPSPQCPFKTFINVVSAVSPKDWKSECGLGTTASDVMSGALLGAGTKGQEWKTSPGTKEKG